MCSVIPLFFYAAEIAAAKMLLFLRKSAAMGFLTMRVKPRPYATHVQVSGAINDDKTVAYEGCLIVN